MAKKQKTIAKQQESTPIDITPLVQQADLQDLRLLTCVCKLGAVANPPSNLNQSLSVHVMPNDDNKKALPIRVSFVLAATDSGGQDGLRIEACYGLMYKIESLEDFEANYRIGFAQIIGINNAWPYWREFVQSITSRMGFPPLTLPLVRPAQLKFTPTSTENANKPAATKRGPKAKLGTK